MGVDLQTYRQAIGRFHPQLRSVKLRSKLHVPRECIRRAFLCLRLTLCFATILLTCGDIESNPGPYTGVETRAARQTTLSFNGSSLSAANLDSDIYTQTSPATSCGKHQQQTRTPNPSTSRKGKKSINNEPEIMSFLQDMRSDFKSELMTLKGEVKSEFSSINKKMDTITESINELRSENESLKAENESMKSELKSIRQKLDYIEGQSRRNNLRFYGIPGMINEQWSVCEDKIRSFIKDELHLPDMESVGIERAHRVKGRESTACPIIVKFSHFKDCSIILQKSKELFAGRSVYSVQPDFTDRVKARRRELGKIMVKERGKGNYSAIQFDKLIVNDSIFKYDEFKKCIVKIGNRRYNNVARARVEGGAQYNEDSPQSLVGRVDDNSDPGQPYSSQSRDSDEPLNNLLTSQEYANETE